MCHVEECSWQSRKAKNTERIDQWWHRRNFWWPQPFAEPRQHISTDYVTNTKGQLDSRTERQTLQQTKISCWAPSQNCAKRLLLSSCLSVGPSVHLSVRPRGTSRLQRNWFSLNLIFQDFEKSVQKFPVSLKSEANNGYFTWRPTYIYDI